MIIQIFQLLLLATLCFFVGYLAFLSVLALFSRRKAISPAVRYRRFAVIIPAHNEMLCIDKTLKSAFAMKYPRDKFDVIVVADNCTDDTARIARSFEAIVLERSNALMRGKGYALRWSFDYLKNSPYEAFIVIDADSVVSDNFLTVMNSYINEGAQVIQASDLVSIDSTSWNAEATRIGFLLYNVVRPLGRRSIGCTAGLRGNGMCFTADTFRRLPWQAFSLTEDLEYSLLLLLSGTNVVFAPEATVYATMPAQSKHAESQRARWETGRYPIVSRYGPELLRVAWKNFSFRHFDALIDLVTPPFTNMLAFSVMLLLVNIGLTVLGVEGSGAFILGWITVLMLATIHVIAGLIAAGSGMSAFHTLKHLPRYVLWKLALYAKLFRGRRDEEWIRTTREQIVG